MDRNQIVKKRDTALVSKLKSYKLKNYNFRLVVYLLVLCGIGVAVVGSASGSTSSLIKQAAGVCIGTVGMIIISLIDYNWVLKFHWLIYIFNIGLLTAVLLIGSTDHGAQRWIEIVPDKLTIQPSEFSKIFLILFFAKFLTVFKEKVSKFSFLLIYAVLAGIPLLLVVKEPDLSTTIVTAVVIIVLIFIAGLSYKKIGIILAVLVPIVVGMIIYIQQPDQKLLEPYQVNRILAFIYPDEYDDLRYQQENSVLAIGSGKLHGKGLYNDSPESMKNANYLSRESINDFIFAVIGEELGFIGSCIILGLMFLIIIECFIIAIFAPDFTGRLICAGIAILLTFQTFVNVGVATEMLPNTGLPLPFISSGLSSMLSLFGGMGFVLNVSLQRIKQ